MCLPMSRAKTCRKSCRGWKTPASKSLSILPAPPHPPPASPTPAARIAVLLIFPAAGTAPARAEYPDRPIRLLLPLPAGGAVDIVARIMAAKMSEDLGKPFVIENKSGAGGIIATDAVAKAVPDGT